MTILAHGPALQYVVYGILILSIAIMLASHILLAIVTIRLDESLPRAMRHPRRIMIVTAHPDDECLFFGVTLTSLVRAGAKSNGGGGASSVFVLCLSKGDLGDVRPKELYASCRQFHIPRENVAVIDDQGLQDGFKNVWDVDRVADKVLDSIRKWNIETIVTFDEYGVSGHPNHIATYRGIKHLMTHRRAEAPSRLTTFTLASVPLYRKYLGSLDLLFTWVGRSLPRDPNPGGNDLGKDKSRRYLIVATPTLSRKAMLKHKSQLVWFRRLNTVFSRYMMVNELDVMRYSNCLRKDSGIGSGYEMFNELKPTGLKVSRTEERKFGINHRKADRRREDAVYGHRMWIAAAVALQLGALAARVAGYQTVTPGGSFNIVWDPLNFNVTPVVTLELVAGPYPDLCNNYSGRLVSNTLVCNDGSYNILIPATETCVGETLFVKITNPWGKFMDFCAAVPPPTGDGILQLATSTSGISNCPGGGSVPFTTEAAATLPSPQCTGNPAQIVVIPPIPGLTSSAAAEATTTASASPVALSSSASPSPTSTLTPNVQMTPPSSPSSISPTPSVAAPAPAATVGGNAQTTPTKIDTGSGSGGGTGGGLTAPVKVGIGVAVLATVLLVGGAVVAYKRRRVPHEDLGSYTQMG
ncbi:LmbE-like protein [Gonapodya prolifera JEL478]|uniref:N-acetylglucosaminylphosphatidylinositol deacetylase n=1 Tax=Gonapodya prolifera (strain JEL478) TaxID=1344416 RepID=A0A139A4K8_GONPJ|nr:LmbE-like protein [Gonapodya prolifera JEL478]|eukprot:KXS11732.1 LmbE-like protein [Gonapodya prolifera JEL478]